MRFLNSDSARPRRRRTRSRSLLDNGDSQYRDHDTIPYGKFLRSIPYLSTVAIHFCSDWGYLLILCYLPSYWRNVYQVSDSQMAFFSVLPCIGIPIVSIFGATFADWLLSQKVSLLQVYHHPKCSLWGAQEREREREREREPFIVMTENL